MDGETNKETQVPEPTNKKADPTLFYNFWLNEIKSIDDSIRIFLSVTILLLSAFFTIVAANFDKITNALEIRSQIDFLIFLFIIMPPLHSWFLSINILMRGQMVHPMDGKPLLDPFLAEEYLVNIFKYKKATVNYSYVFTTIPPFFYLIAFMILYAIFILYKNTLNILHISAIMAGIFSLITTILDIIMSRNLSKSEKQYSEKEAKRKGWWQFWR